MDWSPCSHRAVSVFFASVALWPGMPVPCWLNLWWLFKSHGGRRPLPPGSFPSLNLVGLSTGSTLMLLDAATHLYPAAHKRIQKSSPTHRILPGCLGVCLPQAVNSRRPGLLEEGGCSLTLDKLILEEALKCVAGECWGAYTSGQIPEFSDLGRSQTTSARGGAGKSRGGQRDHSGQPGLGSRVGGQ